MTHESVITLLEDVAKSLGDSVRFGYGALEDFNSTPNKEYPYIWLYPLKGEFPKGESKLSSTVQMDLELNFLVMDSVTGADFETGKSWDEAFQLMEKFVHKLDEFSIDSQTRDLGSIHSDNVELDRARFEAGRKATGDALTGWKLSLQLTVPTAFEYCSIYG